MVAFNSADELNPAGSDKKKTPCPTQKEKVLEENMYNTMYVAT